jgi:hypothetical protein
VSVSAAVLGTDSYVVCSVCSVLCCADYRARMDEMLKTNGDLSKHAQFLEQEQLQVKETVTNLKTQVDVYRRNVPPKKLVKIEETMRDEGVLGVGGTPNANASSGKGAGASSGSTKDDTPKAKSVSDYCTVM